MISFQPQGKMPWNPSKSWKPGTTFQVCRWLTDYMVGYYRLIDRLSVWILFRQSGKSGSEVLQSIPAFLGFTGMVLGCGVACGKMEILGHVTFSWRERQGCNCTSWLFAENIPFIPWIQARLGVPFIPLQLECLCHEWHILIWLTYYDHFVITLCVLVLGVLGFTRFTCQDSTDLTSDLTSKVSAVTLQENASDGNMVTVSWHLSRWALRRPCVSLVMLTLRLSNCVTWGMATQIEDEAW